MTAARIATAAAAIALAVSAAQAAPASLSPTGPTAGAEIVLAATGGRGFPKPKGNATTQAPKPAGDEQSATKTTGESAKTGTAKEEPGFFESLFGN